MAFVRAWRAGPRVIRRWSWGFCVALLRRPLNPWFVSSTPSQRETRLSSVASPCRFTYCESLLRQWVGSRAGQYRSEGVFSRSLSLVCQLVSFRPSSAGAPRPNCAHPFPSTLVFPNPDRNHIYSFDSSIRWFIARKKCSHPFYTLTRNHTPSLVSHTPQWLATCLLQPERQSILTAEGCRLAFTLLFIHLHQFNSIQLNCPMWGSSSKSLLRR